MDKKERRKAIRELCVDFKAMRGLYIFLTLLSVIAYFIAFRLFTMTGKGADQIVGNLSPLLLWCYVFCINDMSGIFNYMGSFARQKTNKNFRGMTNNYDVFTIVPVKKKEILDEELRQWKLKTVPLVLLLAECNSAYIYNGNLRQAAGTFVIITLASVLFKGSVFAERFFQKKWGMYGKVAGTVLLMVITMGDASVNLLEMQEKFMPFYGAKCFVYVAGVPMLVLSILFYPVLLFIYKKKSRQKKYEAWYL